MNFSLILYGIIIGMVVACPFGPIGLIYIQKSLENNKIESFFAGLGIASADMIYSVTAAFGIKVLHNFIVKYSEIIRFVAIIVLCIYGLHAAFKRYQFTLQKREENNIVKAYFHTFLIAVNNPSTIVLFIFLFSFFAIEGVLTKPNSIILIISIFIGSNILWSILNLVIQKIKKRENIKYLRRINNISGFFLIFLSLILIFIN